MKKYSSIILIAFAMLTTSKYIFGQCKNVYNYTGGDQTYVVPPGVTTITVKMWGAGGGAGDNSNCGNGGGGAYVTTTINVTPGETLTVRVGQGGAAGQSGSKGNYVAPSFGGGGRGMRGDRGGGSGGGGTYIFRGSSLIAAAGGGGGGGGSGSNSGDGSRYCGGVGSVHGGTGSRGGERNGCAQGAGGCGGNQTGTGYCNGSGPDGSYLQGGDGENRSDTYGGAGGGGGFYGGEGGLTGGNNSGGGGGGSSFVTASGTSSTSSNAGSGRIAGNASDADNNNSFGSGGDRTGSPYRAGQNGRLVIQANQSAILPAITSSTQTICVGSTVTYSNTYPGGTWSSDNTAVATVNPTTGVVTGQGAGTTDIVYSYTISNPNQSGCGGATKTASRSITVETLSQAQPGTLTITSGSQSGTSITVCPSPNYTVTRTGGGGTAYYHIGDETNVLEDWDYGVITPGNSFTQSTVAFPHVGTYLIRCYAGNSCGLNYHTSGSNFLNFSDARVIIPPVDAKALSADQTICSGTAPNQLSGGTPSNGAGSFTYKWKQSTDNGVTWVDAAGTNTNATYNPPALTATTLYKREVTSASCVTTEGELVNWAWTSSNVWAFNNSIKKYNSVPDSWGTGTGAGISLQSITNNGGYVEAVMEHTDRAQMIGLSNNNTDPDYTSIQFAAYPITGQFLVYESGTYRGSFGTFAVGDRVRVAVENNQVKYYVNGNLRYTSTVTPTFPLYADVALYSGQGGTGFGYSAGFKYVRVFNPIKVSVNPSPTSAGITRTPSGPQFSGTSITITSTPSGGTGPYTYAWNSSPANANISASPSSGSMPSSTSGSFTTTLSNSSAHNVAAPTPSINFNITVTDANGCTIVGVNNPVVYPNIQQPQGVATRCSGPGSNTYTTSTSAPNCSGTGGYDGFVWSILPPTAGTINATTGEVTWNASYSGLATVSVYAKGCGTSPTVGTQNSQSQSLTVNVNPRPTASLSGTTTICNGLDATLTITATGTAPFSGTLSDGTPFSGSSPITVSISPTATTTYTIATLSDANCTATSGDLSGSATVTVNNCALTWNGSQSTSWNNPLNWTPNIVPNNCALDVIIPSVANQPEIGNATYAIGNLNIADDAFVLFSNSNARLNICGNIVCGINNGSKFVGLGRAVMQGSAAQSISGNLRADILRLNNASGAGFAPKALLEVGGILELENGTFNTAGGILRFISTSVTSCAILDNFSAGFSGTVNGSIEAQRYYEAATDTRLHNQHYFGSPVDAPPVTQFAPAKGVNGVAVTPTNDCDETQTAANGNYGNVFEWEEGLVNTCYLQGWRVRSAGNAQNARGYSVVKQGSGTLTLTGAANLDAQYQLPNLTNGGWLHSSKQGNQFNSGWSLAANPYLAPIDLDAASNSAFDDFVLVLRTHGPLAGTFQPISMSGTQLIAPFQGFLVRKSDDVFTSGYTPASFKVNAADRRVGIATFHKNDEHQLSLKVSGNGYADVTYFNFNPASTEQYDPKFDALKAASSTGQPTLFSFIVGSWASVNTHPDVQSTPYIPLGFRPGKNGTFLLEGEGFADLPNTIVFLEDKKENIMHNLTQVPEYTFTSNKSDAADRFVLHFNYQQPSGTSNIGHSSPDIRLFPNPASGLVHIESQQPTANSQDLNVEVFDISGRKVAATFRPTNSGAGTLEVSLLPSAVYQVRITAASGTVVKRLVKE